MPQVITKRVRFSRRAVLKGLTASGAQILVGLPPLVSMGLGSPTAVLFGAGAAFPARYREALFVADWSFGRTLHRSLS